MDFSKFQQMSLASKLTFAEFQHLFDIGETNKEADLVLSMLLSAHSVSAEWKSDILDFLVANNVIDADRRDDLEHNPFNDTVSAVADGVKTFGREIVPMAPDIMARAKEVINDVFGKTGLDNVLGEILGRDDKESPKSPDDVD